VLSIGVDIVEQPLQEVEELAAALLAVIIAEISPVMASRAPKTGTRRSAGRRHDHPTTGGDQHRDRPGLRWNSASSQ